MSMVVATLTCCLTVRVSRPLLDNLVAQVFGTFLLQPGVQAQVTSDTVQYNNHNMIISTNIQKLLGAHVLAIHHCKNEVNITTNL